MATHAQRIGLGRFGERLAATRLEESGLTIIDRNWRCDLGEIDIVALDGHELVIVEVKTRTSTRYGTPVEAVSPAKARRLRLLGGRWASDHQVRHASRRIDVVAIDMSRPASERVSHRRGV